MVHFEQLFPHGGNLFALRDAVRRDEGGCDARALHEGGGFVIPRADVVDTARAAAFAKDGDGFFLLRGRHHGSAHKRRIPHDLDIIAGREHVCPFDLQGVAFVDVAVGLERQEVHLAMNDVFRFVEHLALGNPERGFCDGTGEVVDFDAVELLDADFDEVAFAALAEVETEHARAAACRQCLAQDVVFEAAQREIGFRQEIARAAGRVKVTSASERVLERAEPCKASLRLFFVHRRAELGTVAVEEQRVDDFVDVFW